MRKPRASTTTSSGLSVSERIGFYGLLIAMLTMMVGALPFAYTVGFNSGTAELATYRAVTPLKLPEITQEAKDATTTLNETAAAFKSMLVDNVTYQDAIKKQQVQSDTISTLNGEVSSLKKTIQSQQDTIQRLQGRLAVYENPDQVYNLEKGTSQQAAGGEIIVGMLYYMSGFAELTINGDRESGQAGSIFDVKGLKGGQCRVKILAVSLDDTASFSAACTNK